MPEIVVKMVRASQPLLKEPFNDLDQVVLDDVPLRVFAGEKVKTGAKPSAAEQVGGSTITWVFVEATRATVSTSERALSIIIFWLLRTRPMLFPQMASIRSPCKSRRAEFADACYVQSELSKTNPAYLYALAFAQSGSEWSDTDVKTSDPDGALAFGVYQITKETWAALLMLAELNDLTAERIKSPTAQCVVAGVLASKSAGLLKGLVTDRGISAVDLLSRAHFCGRQELRVKCGCEDSRGRKDESWTEIGRRDRADYPDAAVRTAFLNRNKAIFKQDGSATIEQVLKTCSDKLAAGFDEVKKTTRDLQNSIPANVDDPIFGVRFTGAVIAVTDQDVEALARVSHSEVGNFGKFGDDVLADALGAVVDTIFNRAIYPTSEFPKTIQGVINQPMQFSAINNIGTWKGLPEATPKNFNIVLRHVQRRATGTDSKIKGAAHFFNPAISNPPWGQPIKTTP